MLLHPAMLAVLLALSLQANAIFGPDGGSRVPAASAPPIAEVQQKAIEHARLEPSDISVWKRRARLSALLPRLQLDYGMRFKNEVNVNVNESVYVGSSGVAVGPEAGEWAANENSDHNIGVRAIWSLNEALFNPELLAVSEEARLLARERQALLAEVNRNYYERSRLDGEIAFLKEDLSRGEDPAKVRREIFRKRMAIDEATAALDALTGGWFGGQVKEEP